MLVSVEGCSAPSSLTSLRHLHPHLFGLLPPALIPVHRRWVGHTCQRAWMLYTKQPLTRLARNDLNGWRISDRPFVRNGEANLVMSP
jgi:hypothetical protein